MVRSIAKRVRAAKDNRGLIAGTRIMVYACASWKKRSLLHLLRQGCRIPGLSSKIEISGPRMGLMKCPGRSGKIDESRFKRSSYE